MTFRLMRTVLGSASISTLALIAAGTAMAQDAKPADAPAPAAEKADGGRTR